MRYAKSEPEAGFLLFDNLLTLMILTTVLTSLFPLAIHCISLKHNEARKVEECRRMYESSIYWSADNQLLTQIEAGGITIQFEQTSIKVLDTAFEVIIYESIFEQ